jgi:hypothetical protein
MKKNDSNPVALLNVAREYFESSEILFAKRRSLVLKQLYFHTVELLFKSFLRRKNVQPDQNHDLIKLHKLCLQHGLVNVGEPYDLQNIVSLLKSGNIEQAFRYGTLKSTTEPTLDWTREVVMALLKAVEQVVDPTPSGNPGTAVRATMFFGKPVPK